MSACADPAEASVRALLSLELRERLLPAGAREENATLRVRVRCSGDQVQLWLAERGPKRTLSLTDVPKELHARVLALSIAELQPQPVTAPSPSPAPPPPAEVAPPRTAEAAPARYQLWVGAEASATPLWAFGAHLAFRARLVKRLAWLGALSFAQGTAPLDRGRVRAQQVGLVTGPALLFESERGALLVGAGARAGFTRLSGLPDQRSESRASAFTAWYVGPALFASGALQLPRRVILALDLEIARTLRLRADVVGGGARTLSAWRTGAALGAGLSW